MVDFCGENDIILQPVVAAIPCSVALKVLLAARVRQRAHPFLARQHCRLYVQEKYSVGKT